MERGVENEACNSVLLARGVAPHLYVNPPSRLVTSLFVTNCSWRNIKSDRSSAIREGERRYISRKVNARNVSLETLCGGQLYILYTTAQCFQGYQFPHLHIYLYMQEKKESPFFCLFKL